MTLFILLSRTFRIHPALFFFDFWLAFLNHLHIKPSPFGNYLSYFNFNLWLRLSLRYLNRNYTHHSYLDSISHLRVRRSFLPLCILLQSPTTSRSPLYLTPVHEASRPLVCRNCMISPLHLLHSRPTVSVFPVSTTNLPRRPICTAFSPNSGLTCPPAPRSLFRRSTVARTRRVRKKKALRQTSISNIPSVSQVVSQLRLFQLAKSIKIALYNTLI